MVLMIRRLRAVAVALTLVCGGLAGTVLAAAPAQGTVIATAAKAS
jgi:hypothetical protein